MRLFILDKYKIIKFDLPEKIEDSFLVPYKSKSTKHEDFITVEANKDSWQLKSNGIVNIVNGNSIIDKATLSEYSYYTLKMLGQNDYKTLYALPIKDSQTYKLRINVLTSITIGNSSKCNINYMNQLTGKLHAEIKLVNGEWYIAGSTDESYRIYINGERIITAKLNVGDVIFINGLKIIWMKEFIKINNPKQSVSVAGLTPFEELDAVDNTKYTPVSDEEANVDLYDEDEYFYHLPRIVSAIDPMEIQIDSPPSGDNSEELPFLLSMGTSITMGASSLMMGFNVYNSVSSGRSWISVLPQIVMSVSMIFGSLIMPRIMSAYQKRKKKKREKERQTKYKKYLDKVDTKIQYALKQESQILRENNLSVKDCYDIIIKKNRSFWSREISDEDFLRVRLGVGNIDSFVEVKAPQEHFTLDQDNLQEMVFEVDKRSKTLENVPVTLDIANQTILSFIFECSYKNDYFNGILTQFLALHSAIELKLVIFTNESSDRRWEFAKFLPHCWSDDKSKRFFAINHDEIKEVSSYLEEEFKKRQESKSNNSDPSDPNAKNEYKNFSPYYLIITDDYKFIKNTPIIDFIEKNAVNYGFSFITISNTMKNLPNKCEKFVEIGETESCILQKKLSSRSQVIFTNEYEKNKDMRLLSTTLSNVPLLTKDGLSVLPSSLSFLDMYGVGKIEQLNILNRWQTNNPVASLTTPIGVHADGETFKLDLHEKFHGPHGLIAGSTGSGKSEFIITYILSMCVNYHPYEVQFVLIDYKGGGLAGAFENKESGVKVPHLVGTITNLDTAEMNRTLVSISSELKRRQKKFNQVKDKLNESTMDIYKYQKFYREGLIEEPMSHLFIISDEFAELKSQQPEFLQELVSTARIGRSLGVHLILATQKPSGVVNDQIWSNSKFKVCLKVQDRGDSMEMLKRPEAASIKETGRFYLQVGYDDYFDMGQSGWGGAKYVPTDRIIKKVDDSINFIDNVGNITKSINDIVKKETTEDLGEQLTNIVKYIYNISNKENLITKRLWLDKIPDEVLINDIKTKYNYKPIPYVINPVIGEYDNPQAQSQGILNLDLSLGNCLIYGKGGSGKENLVSTIIWSACAEHTPDEVNFYVIDCGAETLKMFYKFPHVGEIATIDESDKIMNILEFASTEIERRKDLYADFAGSYQNYLENSGNKEPLMVFIINNMEIFNETYARVAEGIQTMYRDGDKYGIKFIITCTTTTGIRGRVAQYFTNKITLQLADETDYRTLINSPRKLVPAKNFGRGLVAKDDSAYEFQTANITDLKQLNNVIKNVAEQFNNAYTTKAKKIKSIPNVVTIDIVKEDNISLSNIPVGYELNTKDILNYNFTKNKFNIVIGNNLQSSFSFVMAIIKIMKEIPNLNLKIIDFVDAMESEFAGIKIIKENFDNEIIIMNNEMVNENANDKLNMYIFVGASGLQSKLSANSKQLLNNLFMSISKFQKSYFMFVDNYSEYKNLQLESWYQSQVNKTSGIWLGSEVGTQMSLEVNDISLEEKKLEFDFMAFVIENGNHSIIKHVVDIGEKNEK